MSTTADKTPKNRLRVVERAILADYDATPLVGLRTLVKDTAVERKAENGEITNRAAEVAGAAGGGCSDQVLDADPAAGGRDEGHA